MTLPDTWDEQFAAAVGSERGVCASELSPAAQAQRAQDDTARDRELFSAAVREILAERPVGRVKYPEFWYVAKERTDINREQQLAFSGRYEDSGLSKCSVHVLFSLLDMNVGPQFMAVEQTAGEFAGHAAILYQGSSLTRAVADANQALANWLAQHPTAVCPDAQPTLIHWDDLVNSIVSDLTKWERAILPEAYREIGC